MGLCASSATANNSNAPEPSSHSRSSSSSSNGDVTRLRGTSKDGSITGRDPSLDLDEDARAGFVGLKNLGNTCYMNSALQCLSHSVPLSDYFLNCDWSEEINYDNPLGNQGKIAHAYSDLLDELWRGDKSVFSPKSFKSILGQYAEQFRGYEQHDAQELLVFLLDGLHEDLNRVSKKPYVEDPEGNGRPEEVVAAEAWKCYLLRNKSIVVDLFQGQLRSTLTCCQCNFSRVKFDPFMYLSLPLPEDTNGVEKEFNLDECLSEFSKEEILEGDEQWRCPKCEDFVDARKKFDIWKVPPVLIVHLKRFTYNSNGRKKKRNNNVNFPIERWNVKQHVKSPQREPPVYDLFAISNHHGGFGSGHYTAYAKGRDTSKSTTDMSWYHFNDSIYKKVNRSDDVQSSDAYVLFYNKMTNVRKNGDIRYSRQSISLPHLWPHLQGIDGMPQTPSGSNAANLMSPQKVNLRESSSVVEWEELMTTDDDGNDLKYYHNSSTGVTTWEKPDGFE
tara:strand:+ start:51 stop:1556 length:1506 start_codon:yes stop_codon:yes gene_type:complete